MELGACAPEAAVLPELLDLLPPQADSRPAAPTTPAPFRKLRRVMLRDSKSMFIEIRSSEILFSFFPILNAKTVRSGCQNAQSARGRTFRILTLWAKEVNEIQR